MHDLNLFLKMHYIFHYVTINYNTMLKLIVFVGRHVILTSLSLTHKLWYNNNINNHSKCIYWRIKTEITSLCLKGKIWCLVCIILMVVFFQIKITTKRIVLCVVVIKLCFSGFQMSLLTIILYELKSLSYQCPRNAS